VLVAFCAAVIAGKPADEQRLFLRVLSERFADVPGRLPFQDEPRDMLACARFAVKMLLHVLTFDDPATAEAGELVGQQFFDEFRDRTTPRAGD